MNDLAIRNEDAIDITAVTRFKHAELWEAVKAFGSQAALAEHLGVNASDLGQWVAMRSAPPVRPNYYWPESRLSALGDDLMAITGKTLDELFPDALRRSHGFFRSYRVVEKTRAVEHYALMEYCGKTTERLRHDPVRLAIAGEESSSLSDAISTLPEREQVVIRARYGIDGEPKTLAETGKLIGVKQERVRQLEARAVRRLQKTMGVSPFTKGLAD